METEKHTDGPQDVPRDVIVKEALAASLGILVFLECRIEPAARVFAGLGGEASVHFPIIPRLESANLLLAFHQDRQRGRLHAPDGGQVEAAFL